jgi:hypothetical protein
MKAKQILQMVSIVVLMATALQAGSTSMSPLSSPTSSPAKMEDPGMQHLLQRLEEIRGIDKTELTRLERKSLRKEVKAIKREMKDSNHGVYLSVGAIIIIILLLILLL